MSSRPVSATESAQGILENFLMKIPFIKKLKRRAGKYLSGQALSTENKMLKLARIHSNNVS